MMVMCRCYETGSPEQRIYCAVTHWDAGMTPGHGDLIDAACQALVDGLD